MSGEDIYVDEITAQRIGWKRKQHKVYGIVGYKLYTEYACAKILEFWRETVVKKLMGPCIGVGGRGLR